MRVDKLKKEPKEVLRIYKYILHTLQKVERKTTLSLRKKKSTTSSEKYFFYILKTVMNVYKRETV
nr:MAG TPA: hypothetical protein [Caudoviricetes sp.]